NPNSRAYCWYGERGITVCKDYCDFMNWRADWGDPPDGLSQDRINNDGNYEPGNLRWATASMQVRNRRPSKRKARRAKIEDIQALAAPLARAASAPAGGGGAPCPPATPASAPSSGAKRATPRSRVQPTPPKWNGVGVAFRCRRPPMTSGSS